MRKYKREDFLKLPAGTIYSRLNSDHELMTGLYCKTSGEDYEFDWIEQNLISECGYPNNIKDGRDAIDYVENLRDTYQDFETDLYCSGRDGCFDDNDEFIVWDRKDVQKLTEYLINCIKIAYES